MIEVLVIGVLVTLSVFSLGMSVDFSRSGDRSLTPVADGGDLDIDLSGAEQGMTVLEHDGGHAATFEPMPLSESAIEELTQEIEALDVGKVDFDLSGMADDSVMH